MSLREVATDRAWVNQCEREGRTKGNRRVGSSNGEVRLRSGFYSSQLSATAKTTTSKLTLDSERRARSDLVAAVDEGKVRYRVEGLEEIGNDVGRVKLGVNGLHLECGVVLSECKRQKRDEGGKEGEHPGGLGSTGSRRQG